MYIIMNMNIYITKENEDYLKNLDGSMSGLINQLLSIHRSGEPVWKEELETTIPTGGFSEVPVKKDQPLYDSKKQEDFQQLKKRMGI